MKGVSSVSRYIYLVFTYKCLLVSALFVERIAFSPLYSLALLPYIIDYIYVDIFLCFIFFPLMYLSILSPLILHTRHTVFIVLKLGNVNPSTLFFHCVDYSETFTHKLHINFRISYSNPQNSLLRFWWDCIESIYQVGKRWRLDNSELCYSWSISPYI